jgi:hypothetical protein
LAIVDACGDELPVPLVSDAPVLVDRQFGTEFDYTALPSNAANELFERRAQIQGAVRKTAAAVAAIGTHLIAAKKILGHGRVVDWIEKECGFRSRTAQNYMAISRLSVKYAFVAHLPVGIVLRLGRIQGRREFLDRISASIDPQRGFSEDEFFSLLEKFKKMRQRRPKRPRGRRPAQLKPVERPLNRYCGLTKTEYARLNAEYIKRDWGFLALIHFREMVLTDTVTETLPFVEAEIRRLEFENGLADLRRSGTQEYSE